jgi:hypothetical protein
MTTTTKDINKAPSSGSAKRKLTVPATRRRSSIGCRTTSHACWNRFRFLAVGSSLGPSSARRRAACSADSPAKDASWSVAMHYTLTGRLDRSEGGCLEVAAVACARSGLGQEASLPVPAAGPTCPAGPAGPRHRPGISIRPAGSAGPAIWPAWLAQPASAGPPSWFRYDPADPTPSVAGTVVALSEAPPTTAAVKPDRTSYLHRRPQAADVEVTRDSARPHAPTHAPGTRVG